MTDTPSASSLCDPPIAALSVGEPRPFWSVMIPTYEPQLEYLAQTVGAVLAQDPGPELMQIELVDDGSRRVDPRGIVPGAARDRIGWFQQQGRVGMGANWNTCIERARGHWVHILHQDDLVLPGLYDRLRAGIESVPLAGAAFCRDEVIDENGKRVGGQRRVRATAGIVEDWIEHVFVALNLRASALVVKRSVYETLGGFRLDLHYALDWDMWKRIAAAYPLWYEPEVLACYRRHQGSATFGFVRSGANIDEIGRSIELSQSLLPPAVAADVSARARRYYTDYAVELAWRAFSQRDVRSGLAQLRAARKLTSPCVVVREIVRRSRRR